METFDELLAIGPGFALKFLVVLVCGGLIGIEREVAGKSAGLRTNLLICLGSMLFTVVSYRMADVFGGDATRVAGQIVTGVGFLGAGVILHNEHGGIRGLTTAAMVWTVAAIGMLIGSGFLWTAVAVTVATLVIAAGLNPLEGYISSRRTRRYQVVVPDNDEATRRMLWLLQEHDDEIPFFTTDHSGEQTVAFRFGYRGEAEDRRKLLEQFYQIEGARIEMGEAAGKWTKAEPQRATGSAGGEED